MSHNERDTYCRQSELDNLNLCDRHQSFGCSEVFTLINCPKSCRTDIGRTGVGKDDEWQFLSTHFWEFGICAFESVFALAVDIVGDFDDLHLSRSEERSVGKECRSRW